MAAIVAAWLLLRGRLSYPVFSILNPCRASSFQASPCFCHTISAPMLTGMILSSISASPLNVKREIAFGPATVFLTLANSSVFHLSLPLAAASMNSSFV